MTQIVVYQVLNALELINREKISPKGMILSDFIATFAMSNRFLSFCYFTPLN